MSRCVLILGALGRWCSPGSAGFSGFEMRGAAKPGILGAEFVDQLAGPVSGLALARGLNSY